MHDVELILTITGGFAAALVLGYFTHRLGLSPIVGYMLAGIAVGPNTPGFMADPKMAKQLAEIGVILMMFGVGLHFDVRELLAVRRIALPGAIAQSAVAAVLGAGIALALGWSPQSAVVFGLSISVASTVVLTRVLADHNELHTPVGGIAIGWLVVQDVLAVIVLVLLPALFEKKAEPGNELPLALVLALAALKIVVVVTGVIFLGGRIIPWLLRHVAATHSRELFTLTILVVALGIAVGSAALFGVSMALGAFLAGMVVGRSDFSVRAATEALPMRDAFAVLFFVSVGMLFHPELVIESPGLIAATLGIVLLGTPLTALAVVLVRGYPVRTAIAIALSLAQIGEFSFIIADLGLQLKLIDERATQVLVATSLVTISLNPLLYRLVDPLDRFLGQSPRVQRWSKARVGEATPAPPPAADPRHRAVIVGYGPVGSTLVKLLRENGIEPTIIEMNLETTRKLRTEGIAAVYGDAGHRETLKHAGLDTASTLILSASGIRNVEEVIRHARELNPDVKILVRVAYLRERAAIRKAGADLVLAGEGEVALAMTESILRGLGATPDQIDRQREGLRDDLLGGRESIDLNAKAAENERDANGP